MSHKSQDHHHAQPQTSSRRKVHHDWRFWTVIAMLAAIGLYVVSFDEELAPEGDGQQVPAAEAL